MRRSDQYTIIEVDTINLKTIITKNPKVYHDQSTKISENLQLLDADTPSQFPFVTSPVCNFSFNLLF